MNELKLFQKTESLHEGRWWEATPDGRVHCFLCPRHCHIGEGQAGFCFIRVNQGGKLYSLGYASPAALQIDPIEKKPLNHFLPGTRVFSVGTAGCNMGCFFCQNWDISKSKADQGSGQTTQLLALGGIDVGDNDLGALGDEQLRRRTADAAGAAGDDGHLAR